MTRKEYDMLMNELKLSEYQMRRLIFFLLNVFIEKDITTFEEVIEVLKRSEVGYSTIMMNTWVYCGKCVALFSASYNENSCGRDNYLCPRCGLLICAYCGWGRLFEDGKEVMYPPHVDYSSGLSGTEIPSTIGAI